MPDPTNPAGDHRLRPALPQHRETLLERLSSSKSQVNTVKGGTSKNVSAMSISQAVLQATAMERLARERVARS